MGSSSPDPPSEYEAEFSYIPEFKVLRSYVLTADGELVPYEKPERKFYSGLGRPIDGPFVYKSMLVEIERSDFENWWEETPSGNFIFQTPAMLEELRKENEK